MKDCLLSDVAQIESGAGFPIIYQGSHGEEFPFLKVSDMNLKGNERSIHNWNNSVSEAILSKLRAKVFPSGALIFPKIGAAIATNKKRQLTRPSCVDNNVMAAIPKPDLLDPDFLYFLFLTKNLSDFASDSNPPSIRKTEVEQWQIRIPPLAKQRRIVDLLSRAEGIVRLRRVAEKKAAELIPALFLDMFGDPATNPKGWPVRKVADFVSRFEGGKNIQAGSENGSAYRILKVSAATSGFYRESERKPAPDGYNPPLSHIVRAGDMLFSRANTEELVGATAIVGSTDGKTLLPDKLWRFVWAESVEPAYMHALFQSSRVRRELGKLSSGTSASMRNISQGKLFGLSLPVAPYAKQKEFGVRAAVVHSIQYQQSAATTKAQATFEALLAQAFSNTL